MSNAPPEMPQGAKPKPPVADTAGFDPPTNKDVYGGQNGPSTQHIRLSSKFKDTMAFLADVTQADKDEKRKGEPAETQKNLSVTVAGDGTPAVPQRQRPTSQGLAPPTPWNPSNGGARAATQSGAWGPFILATLVLGIAGAAYWYSHQQPDASETAQKPSNHAAAPGAAKASEKTDKSVADAAKAAKLAGSDQAVQAEKQAPQPDLRVAETAGAIDATRNAVSDCVTEHVKAELRPQSLEMTVKTDAAGKVTGVHPPKKLSSGSLNHCLRLACNLAAWPASKQALSVTWPLGEQ